MNMDQHCGEKTRTKLHSSLQQPQYHVQQNGLAKHCQASEPLLSRTTTQTAASALLGDTNSLAAAARRLRVLALHAQAPVVAQPAVVPATPHNMPVSLTAAASDAGNSTS